MCWSCVGHVQKRVSTGLWNLKKEKEKKAFGGNGRLTYAMIDKLQNYNGIAIRTNCTDRVYKKSYTCSFLSLGL